jgi:hypothetical protein
MNEGNSSYYNVKDKMNGTMAIEGAVCHCQTTRPKVIIDDHNIYEGQVEVDQFWTVYGVGPVVDKHATK